MRHYIVIILLLSCLSLGAAELDQYINTGQGLKVTMQALRMAPMPQQVADLDEGDTTAPTSAITRTLAFPYQHTEIHINRMTWRVFDEQGNYLYSDYSIRNSAVTNVHSFTFRELTGVTVRLETQMDIDNHVYTLQDVEYELIGSLPVAIPNSLSPAFVDAYEALADNYNYSYLRDLPISRPKMLIISHSQLSAYEGEFITWKRSLGFDVYVAYKNDIGSGLQDIKNFIATHYQQYRCDYLFLWGDVTGTFSIPTNFFPSPEYAENDADDNFFALLEGDDYFPEMLVGRFSFNDAAEFITMCNKTIAYERNPFMTDTNWMRKGLVVAGNYAEGGLRPTTPVYMSRWLRNKMLDYGYTQVDSVFFPPSYPGTTSILQAINQGVQFISYRGWGDANGWHYPSFHIPDLNSTYNGSKMPIVFSIVCNTGDFANSVNPSFGEKWMRLGNPSTPGGCVAFVGPSDLHTKTRFNNSISSGAFRSILDNGVRGFGSSVLIGKVELYKNFPNDIGAGQYVAFYYHVYNVLSDPSLNMWVLVPNTIPESVIHGGLTYPQSANHIRIEAANLENAIVSGTKDGINYTYARVSSGYAILPIDPNVQGNLQLTISKPNFIPLVRELTVDAGSTIGIVSNNLFSSRINPNSNNTLTLGFKNFSTSSYNSASVSITCNNPEINITNATQNLPAMAAGAESQLSFSVIASGEIHPNQVLDFTVSISNPTVQHMFQLQAGGARIFVYNHSGIIEPGQANTVTFTVVNNGNVAMNNTNVLVSSLTTAAVAQSNPVSIGSIAPGEVKTFNVTVTVQSDAFSGQNLPLRFDASNSEGYSYFCFYSAFIGNPGPNDPTGPDEYGYYIYDSYDTAYSQAPVYNWMELDPVTGPIGTVFLNNDDGSRTVNLPFTFRFYGVDYNSLTMCTNGWISFIPTDMVDFFNCYIPAALGPYTMVAGYWDDLKGMKTGVDGDGNGIFNNIRLIYWHDTANNRYIIEWNDAYNQYNIDLMQNASLEKFQIILYPRTGQDGDIVVQYHTVDNPGTTTNYCTVGIEDHTQMRGLTYTHGNTYPPTAALLSSGLAIKFTTDAPNSHVANDDQVSPIPVSNLRNYPNPFNPSTTIAFTTAKSSKATLDIYNLKGQLVKSLLNTELPSGDHNIVWNGLDDDGIPVSSGIFFYNLRVDGYTQTRKMLMMK